MNYYNEFDHSAAEWLRQLIEDGLIPKGDVDERSIADVRATDLVGYTQCHFFAGISGWPLALQLAGWPEDKPVWTGSCPCQAFSTAGKQLGFADERDLWPVFRNLIAECRPDFVLGEQVENAIKHGWLDRVYADLERENYAVGSVVLGAHSVGAPHRRYRLYWGGRYMGDADREQADGAEPGQSMPCEGLPCGGVADDGLLGQAKRQEQTARGKQYCEIDSSPVANRNSQRLEREPVSALSGRNDCAEVTGGGGDCGVADNDREQCDGSRRAGENRRREFADGGECCVVEYSASHGRDARRAESDGRSVAAGCAVCGMANDNGERQQEQRLAVSMVPDEQREAAKAGLELRSMASLPPWQRSAFIYCRDNKIRRVPAESVFLGVADGVSEGVDGIGLEGISETGGFPLTTQKEGRAMLLKGYGNAIVPQVAAEFIKAFMAEME